MIARSALRGNVLRAFSRCYSEGSSSEPSQGAASGSVGSPDPPPPEVPGLSDSVIQPAAGPVGPGVDPNKSGAYKTPEYFQYNAMSFFEAEVEMSKYRVPQPSALKKINN